MELGELLIDPAKGKERATLVLAHGAGGPMDSPFLSVISESLAEAGIKVVRFEFPYMRGRRDHGAKKGPDPPEILKQTWQAVIEKLGGGPGLVIGGKSLGGRIASMIADEVGARGLVCLGYPFHPPGKRAQLRTSHLAEIKTPTLIVQGTRDLFGAPEEVAGYKLSPRIQIAWIEDGDHSYKPRKSSGRRQEQNLAEAASLVASFIQGLA
jgi:hypothetical protein